MEINGREYLIIQALSTSVIELKCYSFSEILYSLLKELKIEKTNDLLKIGHDELYEAIYSMTRNERDDSFYEDENNKQIINEE